MLPRPTSGAVTASDRVRTADVSATITAAPATGRDLQRSPLNPYQEIVKTLVANKHSKQTFNVQVGNKERTYRMPTENELPGAKESTFYYIEVGGFGAPQSTHLGEGLFR